MTVPDQADDLVKGIAGINDVFHHQHVLALDRLIEIHNHLDVTAALRIIAIAGNPAEPIYELRCLKKSPKAHSPELNGQ